MSQLQRNIIITQGKQNINHSSQQHTLKKKKTDHITGEYQAGLKAGKSTMDLIFTVKNLLVKA